VNKDYLTHYRLLSALYMKQHYTGATWKRPVDVRIQRENVKESVEAICDRSQLARSLAVFSLLKVVMTYALCETFNVRNVHQNNLSVVVCVL